MKISVRKTQTQIYEPHTQVELSNKHLKRNDNVHTAADKPHEHKDPCERTAQHWDRNAPHTPDPERKDGDSTPPAREGWLGVDR